MSHVPASPASLSKSAEDATRPPDPPRTLTAGVRRRAWTEARVRPWWMLGLVLLVIGAYFVSTNLARSIRGRRLVKYGIQGEARLDRIGPETVKGKRFAADPSLTVDMTVTLPGQPPYNILDVTLPDNRDTLETQTRIPIYVDRADPKRFTTTTTFSIGVDLLLGGVLLPFIVVLFAYAWFLRGRYLGLWKNGDAAVAVVVDSRQSPIAPFSRIVRCALRDHKRIDTVFSLLVPNRLGAFQPGDNLWIIVNLRRPSRAILAGLYQQA
ncbi:MAG: hypothetical protein ACHRHE_17475 [Tepidisphaerales bacterium]